MKFRVYDNVDKKYVKGLYLDENGKLCTLRRIDFDIKASEELDPDRYTVEFSTGKFDKNGKELFHSDRVIDHYKRIMICEYSEHHSKWRWRAETETNFMFADINQWESKDFEIIGNIH